jgi:predicted SprT family Zn-dependent metalloprotease
VTPPPESSYPTKLVSPSKKKPLIPKAPDLRPSLDAFWNPEVVNDWTDRHSPAKKLVSPKKQQWREDVTRKMGGMDLEGSSSSSEECPSPISKPKLKFPRSQSPEKKSVTAAAPSVKEARMQRKNFADRKDSIAASFLAELDTTICSGSISKMSEATGGIKLVWSKTLNTTAGRANWRREVIRVKSSSNPPVYTTEVRHHCSIELASKVIDDDERLFNVLAHEFCHLLTFMISEVRNNPHGAEFKAWGRKVSAAFADRGVEVTTKHSYAIEYKFVWECVSCGYEFKRHSRSVDTTRHSCGKCKGKLVQTKPVPRNGGAGKNGEGAKQSEYQVFVKENFKKVKAEMALQGLDTQMGKVMEVVAKQYRERKKEKEGTSVKAVDTLDDALKDLKL